MLYMSFTKTWNALTVKNKSDILSDINTNFCSILTAYQARSALVINEVTSAIYINIIYFYLVYLFLVLALRANLR